MENRYQLAYSQRLGGPNIISTYNSKIRRRYALRGKFQDSETYIITAIVSKEDLYLLQQLSSIYIQMATIKEELLVSGMRQIAVTYGNLPSRNGKLLLCIAAALAQQGALSSLPSLTLSQNQSNIQHYTSYKLQLRDITLYNQQQYQYISI